MRCILACNNRTSRIRRNLHNNRPLHNKARRQRKLQHSRALRPLPVHPNKIRQDKLQRLLRTRGQLW